MEDKLSQLRRYSVIVADSGDIDTIRAFAPQDCTTNPSLILKAAKIPAYKPLVEDAIRWSATVADAPEEGLELALDRLAVNFGTELTKIVPGVVSTEVDARLSFNTAATIAKAERLIALYQELGVSRDRILIKIAATWEGIRAAEVLERRGIHCNLTLLFSMAQAVACAEAGVFLISPFVGRILDWYVKSTGKTYDVDSDPGVASVRDIYDYYRHFDYATIVMGASFRSVAQVEGVSGCDRLTVSPALLQQMQTEVGPVARRLDPVASKAKTIKRLPSDEESFRWALNQDAMATEKLAEGIRLFAKDLRALRRLVAEKLA